MSDQTPCGASPLQWHLCNTGQSGGLKGLDCNVCPAWRITRGAAKTIVAFIDEGFDLGNAALGPDERIIAPYDASRHDPEPNRETFAAAHGTACAQLAIGSGAEGTPVGIAPGCRWIPIRHDGRIGDLEESFAFYHAFANQADVIACAWGALDGSGPDPFEMPLTTRRTIDLCIAEGRAGKGTPIVFSAGNGNEPVELNGYANHDAVITVSACTNRGEKAAYSSYGKNVWVCAPSSGGTQGVYIGESATWSGTEFGSTSAAAAMVAGVVALMLSVNPALSVTAVKQILKDTAIKLNSHRPPRAYVDRWGNKYHDGFNTAGHSRVYGWGLIDASAAVSAAAGNRPGPKPVAEKTFSLD